MKSALTRALDRKQSETTEALSYLDTPEHKVGSAVYDLRKTVCDLIEMRLKSETADLVLAEIYSLRSSLNVLSSLVEDVRHARDNMKIAAE